MMAPLAHATGAGWFSIALAAGVFLPLTLLPGSFESINTPLAWLEWISVILAGCMLLPASGNYWPGTASEIVVPITLLVLVGLTENVRRCANVAGVLCWIIGGLFLFIVYMGIQGIHVEWLKPNPIPWEPTLILTMLMPRLSILWKKEEKTTGSTGWLGAVGIALAILVQGNLSAAVASQENAPFYLMARSLRMGSLSRLEPVVSLALTLSWFCFAMYITMSGKKMLEIAGVKEKWALWGTVGTMCTALLIGLADKRYFVQIPVTILWVVIPFFYAKKEMKKFEKSVDKRGRA